LVRGGEEVLLDVGGQDSTEAFEDVGHSDEAREILDGLLVGTLKRQVPLSPRTIHQHLQRTQIHAILRFPAPESVGIRPSD
jgi:cytochrome b involved in lipid metabolism